MIKLATIAALALCVSAAKAAELSDIHAGDLGAVRIEIPTPVPQDEPGTKCGFVSGEITKLNLLAQTSRSLLLTSARTETEFKEFIELWTPVLGKFGISVTGTEYAHQVGILRYQSPDGRVVRDFMADKMNYNALDPAEVKKLQHELLEPLEKAGMTPIASFTVRNEAFRPTFNIYYLTKPEENMDHEVQLRQMKNGTDIHFELLDGKVNIIKKDSAFSMVYIGRKLAFKGLLGSDEADIAAKLAGYKKFLADNNKEFITSRTFKLNAPDTIAGQTYNYALNIYFFQ